MAGRFPRKPRKRCSVTGYRLTEWPEGLVLSRGCGFGVLFGAAEAGAELRVKCSKF